MQSEERSKLDTALPKLRGMVADVPGYKELEDVVGTDDRLSRFIVSRQYDLDAARQMVVDHLTWRKENLLETWRDQMKDKPYRLSSFPHKSVLHGKGYGMVDCAIHAGKSRFGEAVYLEILGGEGQSTEIPEGEEEQVVRRLMDYYMCFLEKRSMILEEMSREQGRRVCTVQVRDVSRMSFMPKSGAFAVVQKIMSMGMLNYPESTSVAFFVNPPSIFMAVFAVVKRWLPEHTNRKFRFVAKVDIPNELMKFLRPSAIVALQRLEMGEDGDSLCDELWGEKTCEDETKSWSRDVDRLVSAGDLACLFFSLKRGGVETIEWERLNASESPKSIVSASLYFVDKPYSHPDAVEVKTITAPVGTGGFLCLPAGVDEALVMICLDHRASWISAHAFKVRIQGRI